MFKNFRDAISNQYDKLQATGNLYTVQIDKDQLWQHYLASFPAGSNPIYRERTDHDCSACKSFIRNIGPVVAIIDDKIVSVWDIDAPNVDLEYLEVAQAMRELIESKPIDNIFRFDCRIQLHSITKELLPDNSLKIWNHFSANVHKPFKVIDGSQGQQLGEAKQRFELFKRALVELSPLATDTAIDLCDSIYRGTEFKPLVQDFLKAQAQFEIAPNPELWLWSNYTHRVAGIRNTAIGTLLIDLSDNIDIEVAVAKFEKVVAPQNYHRTSAVVTPQMIKTATQTIHELGLEPALERRYATINDISVTNVLWANKASAAAMKNSLESILLKEVKPIKATKSATEMTLADFMQDIVPTASNIELLLENKHTPNLCSLITEATPNSGTLFKWNNPFSWSYNGGVTDSMKDRVKAFGGNTDGVLRFSIQWNTPNEPNSSDLDAHCTAPGEHIYYGNDKGSNQSGSLDVDIRNPNGIAVENIIYTNLDRMPNGEYKFSINNFSQRTGKGWSAELEFNGQIYEFSSSKQMRQDETIDVVIVTKSGHTLSIKASLPHSQSTKTIWNLTTGSFHKVTAIMHSPNFWDNQSIGNQHTIFTLEDCTNPEPTRGIYNEFLSNTLQTHRKAFDLIGEKFKCDPIPGNLSGIGFSHTVPNEFTVKADGRQYLIKIK